MGNCKQWVVRKKGDNSGLSLSSFLLSLPPPLFSLAYSLSFTKREWRKRYKYVGGGEEGMEGNKE